MPENATADSRNFLSHKTTEQLTDMLGDDRAFYDKQTIATIKELLIERGMKPNELERIIAANKELPSYNNNNSFWSYAWGPIVGGIVIFIIRIFLVFVRTQHHDVADDNAQQQAFRSMVDTTADQSAWSPLYETAAYNQIHMLAAQLYKDDEQKQTEYTGCVIDKLKEQLPNGLSSAPKDSVRVLVRQDNIDCIKIMQPAKPVPKSKLHKW